MEMGTGILWKMESGVKREREKWKEKSGVSTVLPPWSSLVFDWMVGQIKSSAHPKNVSCIII